MLLSKTKISDMRISNKGGDTEIERNLIHHQLSGVKNCSRERLEISHTVYSRRNCTAMKIKNKDRLYEKIKFH